MRKIVSAIALCCLTAHGADWPTAGGSPQRDGWAKAEAAFTKENVKGLELLYKFTADSDALTTPIVDGRIITYLGFKEMLVFGSGSGDIYSVDADLNRLIWKAHPNLHGPAGSNACGGMTAPVAMPGSSTAVVARGGPRPAAGAGRAMAPVRNPNRSGEFYAVSSDGYLHVLNTSTGDDRSQPVKFVPSDSRVRALNISDGVLYAATLGNCGSKPDALYAMDLTKDESKVMTLSAQGGNLAGTGGTAIGSDGMVYAQAQNLHGEPNDGVFSLDPKTLGIKGYFVQKSTVAERVRGITPVVFSWAGADILAAAGADGRLYLFDPKSLHTPLYQSETGIAGGFHGTFASWEDPSAKERWLYASASGEISGFKVEDRGGKPGLTKIWTSESLANPSAPVITNGVVFAVAGNTLYALDSQTGKKLYSSGGAVPSPLVPDGGLAIANRRIYLATRDHTVYCFGFFADQPQLTGR